MKMAGCLFAAFAMAAPIPSAGHAVANREPSVAGLACIETLAVPLYDGLMWVVKASGRLQASIIVGPDAAGTSVEVRGESLESRIIRAKLEIALREATYSGRCVGQTLEFNFIYRLVASTPSANPHSKIRIMGPNTFEITAGLPLTIPTNESAPSSDGRQ